MKQKSISSEDLYFFNQGKLYDAYRIFGAHLIKNEQHEVIGTEFTLYAPHAAAVNVVGDFNQFEGWKHNLHKIDASGVWRLFVPGVNEWAHYKYEIITASGERLYKADPYGYYADHRPGTNSKVYDIDGYIWNDDAWFKNKKKVYQEPLAVYEMHLGSWRQRYGQFVKFNDIVEEVITHVKDQGFTHVELMPVYEHPLDDSWGYQGTGYYAATSRFGVPKDLMYFIDRCHQEHIGVIMDWVPGHICKDAHGLYFFDGQPLYEYEEHWIRENEVWGTANLDLGKGEVKSFLISNACFWMDYFHVDGFRVDAVSNIIYYLGNKNLGENHGAIQFLRDLSHVLFKKDDRVLLMAEDSTAYPGVTHPVFNGGLGFNYKWNMGWMNDTLRYFQKDPIHRKYHHHNITFGLSYAFSEQYILPFSHDEVVHGKGSLLNKMPGDYWQKFANYRLLMALWLTHPGKKLLFMGQEFAQFAEWAFAKELDWHLLKYPAHDSANRFVKDSLALYKTTKPLYQADHVKEAFQWIDANNTEQSIFIFTRYDTSLKNHVVVLLNMTPVVYHDFEFGVPSAQDYEEILNSDLAIYGGSNLYNPGRIMVQKGERHHLKQFIRITVPPLACVVFAPMKKARKKA